MPPPMIATLGIRRRQAPQVPGGDLGQGGGERGGSVQGFGAEQGNAAGGGILAEKDIDVVQDLYVVADKSDGVQHNLADAFGRVTVQAGLHGGTEPSVVRESLALVGEIVFDRAHTGGYGGGGGAALAVVAARVGAALAVVGVAIGQGFLGETM